MKRDLYVANSGIEGSGVFTKKPFKRGDIILIIKGKETKFFVNNSKDSQEGPNWVGIGKDLWMDVGEDNLIRYINHSCNPNMGIKGRVTCVALRNIKKGEEITFDYSITEEDLFWSMKNGESKNVKGYRPVIKSIQSLPINVYKKYLPYIPRYFQKVYQKFHGIKLN